MMSEVAGTPYSHNHSPASVSARRSKPPVPVHAAIPIKTNGCNSSEQPPVGQNHGAYGSNVAVTAQEVEPPSAHGTESSEGNPAHDKDPLGSEGLSVPVQETCPAVEYSTNTDGEDPVNGESNSTN
ncbi:hypothetical protein GJAV_G00144110 [Gymnothorax javanicus]|nr:hypothetical protein GJAV_G00144110 [Gymnothorax javanicus]